VEGLEADVFCKEYQCLNRTPPGPHDNNTHFLDCLQITLRTPKSLLPIFRSINANVTGVKSYARGGKKYKLFKPKDYINSCSNYFIIIHVEKKTG
jgi:hypothetical protein